MAIEETLKGTESETACSDPIDRIMLDSFYDAFRDITMTEVDKCLRENPELLDKMRSITFSDKPRDHYSGKVVGLITAIVDFYSEKNSD